MRLRIFAFFAVFLLFFTAKTQSAPQQQQQQQPQPCDKLQQRLDAIMQGTDGGALLMVRADTGRLLGAVNRRLFYDTVQPPGSLIKPLTAIAYYSSAPLPLRSSAAAAGEQRSRGAEETTAESAFPVFRCPATRPDDPDGCWDRKGHGSVNIRRAIAFSCNVYFRQLAARVEPSTFTRVLRQFQLVGATDTAGVTGPAAVQRMVGEQAGWRLPPHLLLRAFAGIFNHGSLWPSGNEPAGQVTVPQQMVELLRDAMAEGARRGTSELARREAGNRPILGKTGTSLLVRADGGGVDPRRTQAWWIGLYPAASPEIAVMVFVRNGRGSLDAAPLGGRAIRAYAETGCP